MRLKFHFLVALFAPLFLLNVKPLVAQGEQWKAFGTAQLSKNCLRGMLGMERLVGDHLGIQFSAGVDLIDSRNKQTQEVERGVGIVASTGVRYYLGERHNGTFFGLDAAVSYKQYNWYKNTTMADRSKGSLDALVLIPAVRVGYSFESYNFWNISPMIGVQYETYLNGGSNSQEGFFPFVGVQVGYLF